jgi:hypothetical protein
LGSIKDENGTRGRYEVDPKMPCFLFHQWQFTLGTADHAFPPLIWAPSNQLTNAADGLS